LAVAGTQAAEPQGTGAGLLVQLYDIGEDMRWLPELVPGQQPNLVKVVPTLELSSEREGDFGGLTSQFFTVVTGRLAVQEPGWYAFRLLSDDGARLWIADQLVVDHDGLHGVEPKDGTAVLGSGSHELGILHFQAGGGGHLELQWKPPGATEFAVIPAGVLSHEAGSPPATAPGKKRIIPPLRRGRPGDGTPVAGMHPAFEQTIVPSGMFGVRKGKECTKLEIRANPRVPGGLPVFLVPGPNRKSAGVSWSYMVDPRRPPRPRGPRDILGALQARQEDDPCLWPLVVGLHRHDELFRAMPEYVSGTLNASVFRFASGFPGPLTLVEGAMPDSILALLTVERNEEFPDGRALCFMRPSDRVAFEMLAVYAMKNGFEIEFTKPLDPRCGWEPDSYYIEQWPFDLESEIPECRVPHRDGVVYPVRSASVSPDRKKVFLEIENLKRSHVIYIRLLPPCISEEGELPWSTEAWYSLNEIPEDRLGQVLPPPAKEPQNVLSAEERTAGWRLLFDGETSQGWRGWKKDKFPDGWKVTDACLVRVGPGGDICTQEEFNDFELQLEWRISAGGNSGIFFRASEEHRWPWESGPEMQVLDNAEHADGKNPMTSAGSNYALHAPVKDATQPVGLFNQARILVQGPHVEHWLNGVKVVEYELVSPEWQKLVAESKFREMPHYGRVPKGRIVLQDHGDKVWYRNIKIRSLPPSRP
jgi:hypothetical protein